MRGAPSQLFTASGAPQAGLPVSSSYNILLCPVRAHPWEFASSTRIQILIIRHVFHTCRSMDMDVLLVQFCAVYDVGAADKILAAAVCHYGVR